MRYMWLKYRFERRSEDGEGARFTKLRDLLFFNILRAARQAGGAKVYVLEADCREFIRRAEEKEGKSDVSEYTRQQMQLALEAIHEYRRTATS